MNDQPQHQVSEAMQPDRIQAKADILESNLFNAVSKADDPIVLRFQIDRQTVPDPVIIKALMQLFPRLNIKAPKIILFIRKLLLKEIPDGEEVKTQKQMLSLADTGNPELAHLGIFLRAIVSTKVLAVEIKGVPPIPGKDGAIAKAFFDHESCPGLLKADGIIDFKEINKYPIVKTGDNLFYITPEVQGKSGMQYDGKVIPVPQAVPMSINLKSGVDRIESMEEEKSRGYFLRAGKTGVVVLTRSEGRVTDIEVRDALDVKRLDYSTGNIGTNFICPISMKIDTICSGFSIRARGMVEVGSLEGGSIETDDNALVHSVHPESGIKAQKDVVVHFSRNARLSSLKGQVQATNELVDSQVDGVGIVFEKSKGILSGNTLDGEHISLRNLYFCGENKIYFGQRLFKEKEDLIQGRKNLKEENLAREENKARIMEDLQKDIKQLSKILKSNPLLRDNLKAFILATRDMNYSVLYKELDVISQTMNTKEVMNITKYLDTLRKIPQQIENAKKRDQAMLARIAETEKDMNKLTLQMDGFLRRAATIKIFVPNTESEAEEKPALFLESKEDKDKLIKIQGTYSRGQGFQITQL